MLSLYLRGLGMGLLFTPLLTLSLVNIRNSDMAQASSITNIVRQMGGSFGVAIFSHLLTQRTAFHTQRYGEALNYTGDVYRQTLHSLSRFIEHTGGRTPDTAQEVADMLILSVSIWRDTSVPLTTISLSPLSSRCCVSFRYCFSRQGQK